MTATDRTTLRRSGQLAADSTVDAIVAAALRRPDVTADVAAQLLVDGRLARPAYARCVLATSVRRLEGRGVASCHPVVVALGAAGAGGQP